VRYTAQTPDRHFLKNKQSNKVTKEDTRQLAVEERPASMFPFNKLL
jgi:hypothetical protein